MSDNNNMKAAELIDIVNSYIHSFQENPFPEYVKWFTKISTEETGFN